MKAIVEETVSCYLISWCGYEKKNRENKINICEPFLMFKEVIEQFFTLFFTSCAMPFKASLGQGLSAEARWEQVFFHYVHALRSQISQNHLRKHIFVSLPIQLCKPRRSAFFRGLKIKSVYEIFRIDVKKQSNKQKTGLDMSSWTNKYQGKEKGKKNSKDKSTECMHKTNCS